jgi:serine/threonine-protein kinase
MSGPTDAPSTSYELHEKLGASAFGTQWRGTATAEDGAQRAVVVTVLDTRSAREAPFLERVRKDMPILEGLKNPNIGHIEALIPVGGVPAAVCAEVVGRDLRELLQTGPMPPRAAAELALELAWALHAAHGALSPESIRPLELAHGAVVPEHVLVTGAGEVVLTDYGLHRALHPTETPANDVLNLGCLLYSCLLGSNPQLAASGPDDVDAAIHAAVRQLDPALPAELGDLLRGCFAANPDMRPPARDVARQLRLIIPNLQGAWLSTWADERIGGAPRERAAPTGAPTTAVAPDARPAGGTDDAEGGGDKFENDNLLRPLKKAKAEVEADARAQRRAKIAAGLIAGAVLLTVSGGFVLRRFWLPYFGPMDGPDVPTDQAGPDQAANAGPVTVRAGGDTPGDGVAEAPPGGPVTVLPGEEGLTPADEGAAPRPDRALALTDDPIEPAAAPGAEGAAAATDPAALPDPAAPPAPPKEGPPPWPRPDGTLGPHDLFVEVALARSVALSCDNGLSQAGRTPERVAMMQIPAGRCTVSATFPPDEDARAQVMVDKSMDLICRIALPGQLRCAQREIGRAPAPAAPAAAPGSAVDIELRAPLARALELRCGQGFSRGVTSRERILAEQVPSGTCEVTVVFPEGAWTGTFSADRNKSVICLRGNTVGKLRCSDAIPLP